MPSIQDNAKHAKEWLERNSKTFTHDELASVRVVDSWERTYSHLFLLEAETRDRRYRVICKRSLFQPDNSIFYSNQSDPSTSEFEILASITGQLGESTDCQVPRPLFVVPEEQSIYMEFVEGTELESMMRHLRRFTSRSSFLQLGQAYFRVGQWLHQFQHATGLTTTDSSGMEMVIEHCDHRLRLIQSLHDWRCPSDLHAQIMNRLRSLQSWIEMPIQLAGCHGDFGPWNIITRNNKITVIDFFAYRRDFIGVDLLNVLINLENQNAAPTFSGNRIRHLNECFLDGYGFEGRIDPHALQMAEILQRVCSIHGSLMNRDGDFRQRLRSNRILTRNLQKLMASITNWSRPSFAANSVEV